MVTKHHWIDGTETVQVIPMRKL